MHIQSNCKTSKRRAGTALLVLLLAGCGESLGRGSVQVFITVEETISSGLTAGDGDDNIRDGWNVTYDAFVTAVGNFRATRSANRDDRLSDPRVVVFDLKALPSAGYVLSSFSDVSAARWDVVGYDMPNANGASERAAQTSQASYDRLVQNGWSLYFEATLTKIGGQSCRPGQPADCVPRDQLLIRWGVPAGTAFDDCAPVFGAAGFAVPAGGTAQVKPTIHGDHWFFSNITQGAEITQRRAQWVVDCDLDRDGETTLDELKQVKAAEVFRPPTYNLTGALGAIDTAYDYLLAQARTLGDFQGVGECPTRRILP
jgi:hypothetical protein